MESIHLPAFVVFIIVLITKCNGEPEKSKNPLPYFRRQSEEDFFNQNPNSSPTYDKQSHLVSFLVNNVQEIFRGDEATEFSQSSIDDADVDNIKPNSIHYKPLEDDHHEADIELEYANMSTHLNMRAYESVSPSFEIKYDKKKTHSRLLSESSVRKSEQKVIHNHTRSVPKINALVSEETTMSDMVLPGHERSCIFCDNVRYEDCVDPKNKLIPSVMCKREGDECYSLHTPFGIVDRGCFNFNRNLTSYVCSCNLCNYHPITDMPHIFTNKREWAHNVVELSRARNLRNSVAKDMACLKCEVNNTARSQGNLIYNSNCLNGNIGNVATEVCDSNEVCGIKVIKSEGYIWRGCVKTPLYNYYWSMCNTDLCNYDTLISIYDYI